MNITPEQAATLAENYVEPHEMPDCPDAVELWESSYDLAQTIAGMEYEYAAQVKEGGEWFYIGLYGPDEPWGPEEDVREYQVRCQIPGTRLVRRLVSEPVEVIEGE